MSLITTIWNAIPLALRKYVGIGLAIGIGLAVPLTLWLFWASGYIPEKLGITKQDLQDQTTDIADANIAAVEEVAMRVVAANDSNLRAYMAAERRLAVDTTLVPLLKEVKHMKQAQAGMIRSQQSADGALRQLPAMMDEKLERVLRSYRPERTEQQLNQLLEHVNELRQETERLREQNRVLTDEVRGKKPKTQRF